MAEENRRSVRRKKENVNLDTLGLEMGNKPPQALDVEEAVLGALLIEPNCIDEAMDELWNQYMGRKQELAGQRGEGNHMRRTFGNTYWWYYQYK